MSLPTWDQQIAAHIRDYGEEPLAASRGYFELMNHLSFHERRKVISFEILPTIVQPEGSPVVTLVDGTAIAISKRELIKAFTYARNVFFGLHPNDAYIAKASSMPNMPEKTRAAQVILLSNPEHLTASNYLKRHLQSNAQQNMNRAVVESLWFLDSVLTSPLHKHSKSPTLWSHRLWLVKTFTPWESLNSGDKRYESPTNLVVEIHTAYRRAGFWRDEFAIAIQAAGQHDKNFYAFQYLRQLWTILWTQEHIWAYHLQADSAGSETLLRLSTWCRRHPGDISGWTFFVWLCIQPQASHHMKIFARRQLGAIETFKDRLSWRGESVDYFLRSMNQLAPAHFPDAPICVLRNRKQPEETQDTTSVQTVLEDGDERADETMPMMGHDLEANMENSRGS